MLCSISNPHRYPALLPTTWEAAIVPWAEIPSPRCAMSKSRPFSLWVQLAAAPLGKWAAAILEETVNVLMEGRRRSVA